MDHANLSYSLKLTQAQWQALYANFKLTDEIFDELNRRHSRQPQYSFNKDWLISKKIYEWMYSDHHLSAVALTAEDYRKGNAQELGMNKAMSFILQNYLQMQTYVLPRLCQEAPRGLYEPEADLDSLAAELAKNVEKFKFDTQQVVFNTPKNKE